MNYLFRNFVSVLRKFTTSSIINIVGLSVALLVFFVVLIQVHYDLTYDRGYKNADRIAQFYVDFGRDSWVTLDYVNQQDPREFQQKVPELKSLCLVSGNGETSIDLNTEGGMPQTFQVNVSQTNPGFFAVFTPEIVRGDTTRLLDEPDRALISKKTAERLFGQDDPIGQVLYAHDGSEQWVVQAVYRDFPANSSLENGIYTYLKERSRGSWGCHAYFLVDTDLKALQEKVNSEEVIGKEAVKVMKESSDKYQLAFCLTRLNEHYLTYSGMSGSKRLPTTLSLLAIGVLTLLVAFVNFINLAMAMAPSRVRGICIRRVLGINRTTLRLTIASESVLFVLLSGGMALLGLWAVSRSAFAQDFFPAMDVPLGAYATLLAGAFGAVLLLAFLVGLYTMRYSTSFDEAEVLKGSFASGVKASGLRNALVILQFATAIALICISIFIKQQNDYMLRYDWGFDREQVAYVPLKGMEGNARLLGEELLRDARVTDYCLTGALPGSLYSTMGTGYKGQQVNSFIWSVDERFFDFFDITLLEGRLPEADTIPREVMINEAFLRDYSFDAGEVLGTNYNGFHVVGLAKDMNFQSLRERIKPMSFWAAPDEGDNFQYLLVKLTGNDLVGAVDHIRQVWGDFSSEPFEVHFLDDHMDQLYQQETNMAKLIGLFGLLVVLIAVMGVYGLIVFTTKQKAKEIAIRKVNGSSVREILLMLNRNVLSLLGVAFVIAVPVAYYFIQRWLENFAYKTPVHAWVFLLGGLVVLAITLATVSGQSYRSATANPTRALNKE